MNLILSRHLCEHFDYVGELQLKYGGDEFAGLRLGHHYLRFGSLRLPLLLEVQNVHIFLLLPGLVVVQEEAHEGEEPVESLGFRLIHLHHRNLIHFVSSIGVGRSEIKEELQQFINNLIVKFDAAKLGLLKFGQEHF